ncbi:hypothetical protein Tco_1039288 [Tanacetum coccineum]
MKKEESLNMTFNETPPPSKTSPLVDDDLHKEEAIKVTEKKNLENDIEDETLDIDEVVNIKESMNHPLENVIGNLNKRTLRYIKEMLKKFGLEDPKPMKTPMSPDTKLTKPDIMFSVCLCARFQEDPKTSNLEAVKRIFRYIKGTTHLRLWTLSNIMVLEEKTALAISTTKAKYVSAGKACQQALWMEQALIDYDVRLDDVSVMCNNKGAIELSKNHVQHAWTKYIIISFRTMSKRETSPSNKFRLKITSPTFLLNPSNANRLIIFVLVW